MKLIFNILFLLSSCRTLLAARSMGPIGNIIIESIYECPENERPTTDDFATKVELNVDDQGVKSVSGSTSNKITLDDNLQFAIEVHKLNNGKYVKYYSVKGKPCKDLRSFVPDLWEKFVKAMKPTPDSMCPIKAGDYTIDGFQASSSDVKIPVFVYGKVKLKTVITNKKGETVFCIMSNGESQPK